MRITSLEPFWLVRMSHIAGSPAVPSSDSTTTTSSSTTSTSQPPAAPPRRLVTIVKEKTNRSSFCQLDGKASDCEEATEPTITKTPPSTTSPTPTPATPSAGLVRLDYRGRPLMPPEDGTTAKCGYRCGYQIPKYQIIIWDFVRWDLFLPLLSLPRSSSS